MLRTYAFALSLMALGAAPALAQEANNRGLGPVGMEVRGDDGELMGHVTGIMRDETGRIIGVSIEGLEPGDAPAVRSEPQGPLVAERRDNERQARQFRRESDFQLAANR